MSQVNRVPFGLQYLFGSQNFGRNPRELLEGIRPGFDISQFFGTQLMDRTRTSGVATAIGATVTTTIPANQMWQVFHVELDFQNNFAAGARARGKLEALLIDPDGTAGLGNSPLLQNQDAPTILNAVSVGVSYGVAEQLSPPRLYGPGTQFRSTVTDLDLNGGVSVLHAHTIAYYRYEF